MKTRRRKYGIFQRTFLLSFLLSLSIILIFSLITIPRLKNSSLLSLESQARSVSTSIAQVCGNSIVSGDYSFIVEHNMMVIKGSPDILYVIVVRRDGFTIVHTASGWSQYPDFKSFTDFKDVKSERGSILYSDMLQQKVFHYMYPLLYSGLDWGELHVGISIAKLNNEVKYIYRIMFLLGLFCLGIALVGAYFFARKITHPILSLRDVTSSIAQGDLLTQVNISTGDEIEELAASFNNMTKQLEKTTVSRDYMNNILNSMNESLLVVSPEGSITSTNASIVNLLSYPENELIGQPINVIFSESEISFKDTIIHSSSLSSIEKALKAKNGRIIPVLFSSSIMYDDNLNIQGIICVATDITERKKTEGQIQASLKEKEVLLKEIHHRVKNNMQVIISLLKLQAGYIKDIQFQYIFEDIINRIYSMALVHLLLYKSDNFSNINFKEYIEKLCEYLTKIYKVDLKNIAISYDIHNIDLQLDIAIPCGLLINELISNSIKYAFTDKVYGEILISMKELKGNIIELTVSDNGKGLPEDMNWRKTDSFGLQIVLYMAEGQLEGKVKLNRKSGTEFIITFPK